MAPTSQPNTFPWPPGRLERTQKMLTVSDVERLAKAGVQIKMDDVIERITPDPMKEDPIDVQMAPQNADNNDLLRALWHRLRMNTRALQSDHMGGGMYRHMPVQAAVRHGDTIHIFVHTGNSPPCIIEDEAVLFPSDALMAKIALLEKVEKGNYNTMPAAQAGPYTGPPANRPSTGRLKP